MNQKTIIRTVKGSGNGGHIITPKEWVNGIVEVKLINNPINIEKDLLEILKQNLSSIVGIYLSGSYARKDQTSESDIDVLVITDKLNKKTINENIIPLLPMLMEANPIINFRLLQKLKDTKITKKNLTSCLSHIKSSMKINKGLIDLNESYLGDSIAYSLILGLRSVYIINNLINHNSWNNTDLKQLIKKVSGSLISYEGYLRVKGNKKKEKELPIEEARKLYEYIIKNIEEQEKWIKRKG